MIFWEVDILEVDISGVDILGVDILRLTPTDKLSEHQGPWSAPHLVSVLGFCLLLYLSLNFSLLEHPQD